MKILGIDYGAKRIGVAVAEMAVRLAFPKKALRGTGDIEGDAEMVNDYARREECSTIIVGLPLLESGEEGEQARIAKQFGGALAARGLNVVFWDERFTTAAARMALEELPAKRRALMVDSEAARIMLIDFLSKGDG